MMKYAFALGILITLGNITSAEENADVLLAEYLMKYEDLYQEFAVRYRGEVWSSRPRSDNPDVRERIRFLEGIVVGSRKLKLDYGGQKSSDGLSSPWIHEELFIEGGRFQKNYRPLDGKSDGFSRAHKFEVDGPQISLASFAHPHGLVLVRDTEFYGKQSQMDNVVRIYQKHRLPLDSTVLPDGKVKGVWRTPSPGQIFTTIDFSKDRHLPIRTVFSVPTDDDDDDENSKREIHCVSSAKWSALDKDSSYPSEISISSTLGVDRTEMSFEFQFASPETVKKRMSKITPVEFSKITGTGWLDEFSDWFDEWPTKGK